MGHPPEPIRLCRHAFAHQPEQIRWCSVQIRLERSAWADPHVPWADPLELIRLFRSVLADQLGYVPIRLSRSVLYFELVRMRRYS